MRLISCYIDGFGRLSGMSMDFKEGCNLFVRENGWGKSTFAAFIRVMLYGFDGETKRNELENERKKYKPWNGDMYGGELVFEAGGKCYRLQRTFGARRSSDTFALYDADTNMPSRDYTDNLGEEIFGLDAQSFARTMYIGQGDCRAEATDGVNAKIGNAPQSRDDMGSYENARMLLKDVINHMSPSKKTGELYKRRRELSDIKEKVRTRSELGDRIRALEAERLGVASKQEQDSSYRHLTRERDRALAWFAGGLPDKEELCTMIGRARELEKLGARLEAAGMSDEARLEYGELIERYGGGEGEDVRLLERRLNAMYRELASERDGKDAHGKKRPESRLSAVIFAALAVMCVLLAAGTYMGMLPWGKDGGILWIIFAAAAACCAATSCALSRAGRRADKARAEALRQDRDRRLSLTADAMKRLVELKRMADREDRLYDKYCECSDELSGYIKALGFEPGDDMLSQLLDIQTRLADYRQRCEDLDKVSAPFDDGRSSTAADRLAECDRQLMQLRDELMEKNELACELDELTESYEEDLYRYGLVTKTYELLENAKQSFVAKYNAPVMDAFAGYYEKITGESAENFMLDADMRLSVRECGMYRSVDALSDGRKDLLGICLRLAFVDAMYKDEKPLLVLDDVFSNLDDDSVAGGGKLLSALAEKYQFIYFTCSAGRALRGH